MLILQIFTNQTVTVQLYSCVQNTGAQASKEVCKPVMKMKKASKLGLSWAKLRTKLASLGN